MQALKQHFLKSRWFRRLSACGLAAGFVGAALSARAQPEIYGDPASSAFIRIPADADDWTRHFRVGALVGLNINANFNMKGQFNASGNKTSGVYDDGYVHADKAGSTDGYTSYWGYDKASQYDAATHTLTMHSASTFAPTSSGAASEGGVFPGFEMAYGDNLWYWKHARVGWELGFGLLPISITDSHRMNASVNQSSYKFNTGDIIVPGAPYQGGSSGQGPLISTQHSVSTTTDPNGIITGSRTLDVTLYTVRLGPSFYWDLSENVGMSLGAGPAIGIASGDYSYNETITTGSVSTPNHGSFGSTDVVFGGYVNGALMYHIDDNGRNADLYLGVQYMPMQDANFSSGGRSSTLNLGGQVYISAGINWPF